MRSAAAVVVLAFWCGMSACWAAETGPQAARLAAESARQVPVAYEVDVVVVGGSSGAVSAAVAAAKAGAKVFVAAPRPYLGEDIAGALRLALEAGEKPASALAANVFSDKQARQASGLPFKYEADQPSMGVHKDTKPPSALSDGKWSDAAKESVQYDADVTLSLDLGKPCPLKAVHAFAFRGKDYDVESMSVSVSADNRQWRQAAVVKTEGLSGNPVELTTAADGSARYIKCVFKKKPDAARMLLGEIVVESAAPPEVAAAAATLVTTPMQIKRKLDLALAEAGAQVLYGCYATDVLRDGQGNPAGIVMADRAGRQAVVAKVVIDATQDATVARLAGAEFRKFGAGTQTVTWVVLAKDVKRPSERLSVRKLVWPVVGPEQAGPAAKRSVSLAGASWYEYTLRLDLPNGSWAARANLDQQVRDIAYDPSQIFTADEPFFVFPQAMKAAKTAAGAWPGAAALDLDVLRPAGVPRVYVLGPCADMGRDQAEKLLRPAALMEIGDRVGAAAAAEAKGLPSPQGVKVARAAAPAVAAGGDVKESLGGLRPAAKPRVVPQEQGALPVLGVYDVVVVGGGTSGAPAGIGAARQGARTLVIEYLNALGGVGTAGLIGTYWYGNRVGFTKTVPESPVEIRMEWYRSELRKAKADIWFGALGCGAWVDGNCVKGVVVATPYGRGVVLAKTVIDGTGNADTAAAAGAETVFVEDDFALQNAHLPSRNLGPYYVNGDRPAIDDADPLNVRAVIQDKLRTPSRDFDLGQLMDTRERRRIVGDYCLDWLDIINQRTFPDSIVYASSDYDSHGYQIHPFFDLTHVPARTRFYAYVPYRCLLPKGLDGILVVGVGFSAHRDATPITRMQPDLHNLGYAAGVAAAMASRRNYSPRQIDVRALQRHLVEIGNLAKSVLTDQDSLPMPAAKIRAAVAAVKDGYKDAEVLLAQPKDSLPLLRAAYAEADAKDKPVYAHVLAAMGDPLGVPTLIEAIKANSVAAANAKRGSGGRYGMIRAIGLTRDRRAVATLAELAKQKEVRDDPQLVRALASALGRIGDPAAADALADLLAKPDAARSSVANLMVARALFRCGDKDGLARRWLENCAGQADGPQARLAWQTLNSRPEAK